MNLLWNIWSRHDESNRRTHSWTEIFPNEQTELGKQRTILCWTSRNAPTFLLLCFYFSFLCHWCDANGIVDRSHCDRTILNLSNTKKQKQRRSIGKANAIATFLWTDSIVVRCAMLKETKDIAEGERRADRTIDGHADAKAFLEPTRSTRDFRWWCGWW